MRPAVLTEKLCPGGAGVYRPVIPRVKHVFSELYHVPEEIRKGYLKVKLLELLLFLSTLTPNAQPAHGCTAAQAVLAEQVRTCLLAEPDRAVTLRALSERFGVSEAQVKTSFAGVYGMSPAAYLRAQRMWGARGAAEGHQPDGAGHCRAVRLRQCQQIRKSLPGRGGRFSPAVPGRGAL